MGGVGPQGIPGSGVRGDLAAGPARVVLDAAVPHAWEHWREKSASQGSVCDWGRRDAGLTRRGCALGSFSNEAVRSWMERRQVLLTADALPVERGMG